MRNKAMKAINCQNCGASDFINLNGKTICAYCHTEYRISNSKYRHRKFFSITISLFAIVILSLLKYVQPFYLQQAKEPASPSTEIQNEKYENTQKSDELPSIPPPEQKYSFADKKKFAHDNITKLQGWNLEKFNQIQVAQTHLSENNKHLTYSEGDLFTTVIQNVGSQPTHLKEDIDGYFNPIHVATWSTGELLAEGYVSIIIVYDDTTNNIISKHLSGSLYE
ncbi:TFIIB-type zinc finger domain-containing protein [Lactococcus formosensis]|uniref:TFIIB-type zinc finger domain-containing protein n=1 Tax=Lactococcus formosensis TaxID=1281486 RepID=UPI001BCA7DD1|nr:TFIIB-type zinc finger domain-containing protein [Lactococcus formosensis]